MSVVIIGGNECMARRYQDLCAEYRCQAKVFTKMRDGLKNQMGNPDLLVLFTGTTSHKMVTCALSRLENSNVTVARSHSSSVSALRRILEENTGKKEA